MPPDSAASITHTPIGIPLIIRLPIKKSCGVGEGREETQKLWRHHAKAAVLTVCDSFLEWITSKPVPKPQLPFPFLDASTRVRHCINSAANPLKITRPRLARSEDIRSAGAIWRRVMCPYLLRYMARRVPPGFPLYIRIGGGSLLQGRRIKRSSSARIFVFSCRGFGKFIICSLIDWPVPSECADIAGRP